MTKSKPVSGKDEKKDPDQTSDQNRRGDINRQPNQGGIDKGGHEERGMFQ